MMIRLTRVSPALTCLTVTLVATLAVTGVGQQQPPSKPDSGQGAGQGPGGKRGQRGPRGPRPQAPSRPIQIITDLADVNPEFALIGEYTGDIQNVRREHVKVGIQIGYAGVETLRIQTFLGGLPGDGWDDRRTARTGFGKFDGETLMFSTSPGPVIFVVQQGEIDVLLKGEKIGWARKDERTSPTAGKPPPEGADRLFDGSGLQGLSGGTLDPNGLLLGPFSSQKSYQGHLIHLEFRLPYVPDRGPKQRGMNRVLIQGRYELSVKDSLTMTANLKIGGAIVGADIPRINMSYPPLRWQTLDIDFRAARYDASGALAEPARTTMFQNGVLIHDDVELPEASPLGLDLGPEPGPLVVSGDGCPVAYRNIWVLPAQP